MWHLERWLEQPPGTIRPPGLIAVWTRAAAQAGFLDGGTLAQVELQRWKLAAEMLAVPGLTQAERKEIIDSIRAREREVLGETATMSAKTDRGTDE
jgi:hypothetical protein